MAGADGVQLSGTPVFKGMIRATARVALNLEEAKQIQNGDILITRCTDIGWSPYFPLLSGVVTELGGLISHGAVVAREYVCNRNPHYCILSHFSFIAFFFFFFSPLYISRVCRQSLAVKELHKFSGPVMLSSLTEQKEPSPVLMKQVFKTWINCKMLLL